MKFLAQGNSQKSVNAATLKIVWPLVVLDKDT
jgi:hypothetical protein